MNFLSHFYHEQPTSDPYYVAGVIFPDILSHFSRVVGTKVRLQPSSLSPMEGEAFHALSEGVRQHYIVDGFFHDSDYFDTLTDQIEQLIRLHSFSCFERRLFAFSHIFLELMMDRVLLLQDQQLAHTMYDLLGDVDEHIVEQYCRRQTNWSEPSSIARHFNNFVDRKFLYHYLDEERFTGILDGMNRGFGNPAFSLEDRKQLMSVITAFEQVLQGMEFPIFTDAS